MREIKFRAWDGKEMLYEGFVINPDGVIGTVINDHDWPELKVMQYTGLKDKNGTEIYEGDIFRSLANKTIYKVEYWISHQMFQMVAINEYARNRPLFHCNNYPELEVIGNIYENPELLNSKEDV